MNLSQNQQLRQRLILTNKMKQSLAFLQMTIDELSEAIKKEADENPVLENAESERAPNDLPVVSYTYDKNDAAFYEERTDPLLYAEKTKTLKDYLYEQLGYLKEDKNTKRVISYMIECIDCRGYLSCGLREIANDLGVSEKTARACLFIAQEFQPFGVFARDLSECLIIQLRKKNIRDGHAYEIAENHLKLLSENKIKAIARKLGISVAEAVFHCDIIKALEPKPSRGFADCSDNTDNPFITPEAYIKKAGGALVVILNEENLPRLKIIDRDYIKRAEGMFQSAAEAAEEKRYINERINSARFLIRCVEHRKKTMRAVLEAIVKRQESFFLNGQLMPMTIREIAESVGCHESTVSRAIQNKYVETPVGLIRIKSLFTAGCGENEARISAQSAKNALREVIRNEDKRAPLSDNRIAGILSQRGISVSRRAIAKYRSELEIPAASRRKTFVN